MSLIKSPKRRGFAGSDDRRIELPEGSLTCRSCGIAVRMFVDTPVERLTLRGQRNANGYGNDVDILVTRCNVCADRRDRAARILHDHPAIIRENGDVALDRLDGALAVLDLLGRLPIIHALTVTDAAVRDLIDGLAPFGGAASWSGTRAAPGVCASRRWGVVSDALWAECRREFAEVVRRRFELSTPVPPPEGQGALRGCAFCGIGFVVGKKSNTHALWGDPVRIPVASIGGAGGEIVMAHLCPVCRPALVATGAVGLPAAWSAILKTRGYVARSSAGVVSLSNVRPWAALPRGTEPNEKPWQHVNLVALDRELASTTVVRRVESELPMELIVGWVK